MPSPVSVAKAAVREAGALVASRFSHFRRSQTRYKAYHESVTDVDLASERLLIKMIHRRFPSHFFFSEEAGAVGRRSEYQWLLDPIDGTLNFTMKNPLFFVSVALAHKGSVIAAAMYAPLLKRLYWAEAGKGAYCNGKRICVSRLTGLTKTINAICHAKNKSILTRVVKLYARALPRHIKFRHFGSVVYEMSEVAAGRMDAYLSMGLHPGGDIAAGQLLVKEAGGRVTDFAGRPWKLFSSNCLATNGRAHDAWLRELRGL